EVDYQNASDRKGSVAQEKMHRRDCRMASDDLSVRRQSWEERTPLPAQKMLAVFSSHCYAGSCSRGQCSVVVVTGRMDRDKQRSYQTEVAINAREHPGLALANAKPIHQVCKTQVWLF